MDFRESVSDWKRQMITQEFFEAIKERINGLKDEIVGTAHDADPRTLAYKAGAVQALSDVLDVDF